MVVESLFKTGIRPAIDKYLLELSKEERDYGEYWSASSAGYCQRLNTFKRLGVPPVETESDARKQRLFTAGHIFHDWVQQLTKAAKLSTVQEFELQDEELMVRGHIDDLILINGKFILYDYKTRNSKNFGFSKEMSYYHKMQLGTYLYLLNKAQLPNMPDGHQPYIEEARILNISKDDLRMTETQLMWTPELESDVLSYWSSLNHHWTAKTLPECTCDAHENGFMAREKWNPYFYNDKPCSLDWYKKQKEVIK